MGACLLLTAHVGSLLLVLLCRCCPTILAPPSTYLSVVAFTLRSVRMCMFRAVASITLKGYYIRRQINGAILSDTEFILSSFHRCVFSLQSTVIQACSYTIKTHMSLDIATTSSALEYHTGRPP